MRWQNVFLRYGCAPRVISFHRRPRRRKHYKARRDQRRGGEHLRARKTSQISRAPFPAAAVGAYDFAAEAALFYTRGRECERGHPQEDPL
ncbi:hypothetical protein MTO96_013054 [Rhipicephalus appendiculatus]